MCSSQNPTNQSQVRQTGENQSQVGRDNQSHVREEQINKRRQVKPLVLAFFLLRDTTTQPAVRSLSEDASKTLVQAFISCRLDYCNSLFFGISDGLMSRLQSVQNAATRLVTGTRRFTT